MRFTNPVCLNFCLNSCPKSGTSGRLSQVRFYWLIALILTLEMLSLCSEIHDDNKDWSPRGLIAVLAVMKIDIVMIFRLNIYYWKICQQIIFSSRQHVFTYKISIFSQMQYSFISFHGDLIWTTGADCNHGAITAESGPSQLPWLRCHENPLCHWENMPAILVRTVCKLKTFKTVRWSWDKFNETQFCVCPKSKMTIWDLGQRQSADNPMLVKQSAGVTFANSDWN